MHVDPADVWEARLRDAPAASAAEAILASLLGYRDSHVLHADDVAQLASALEAWGTLVLGGARPDGSPFVPPTSDERASAAASLVAIAFAERERSAAVAALAAHVSAKASRPTVLVRFHPQAWLNDHAIGVDPEGDTDFEVPAGDVIPGVSDALRDHPNAPRWIRDWSGPFYCEIVNAGEAAALRGEPYHTGAPDA